MLRHIKITRKRSKRPLSSRAPGRTTIVITDKTGVLTKNELAVSETWQPPESRIGPAEIAMRAAQPTPHSPLDAALTTFAKEQGAPTPSHPPLRTLQFSQDTGMSGSLWHSGSDYGLAVKGAPEYVLGCSDLTEGERERANAQFHKLAGKGYHVVALAHRVLPRQISSLHDLTKREKLEFGGLLAIADVVEPKARRAVAAALSAGSAVYIATGDHLETAYHLGHELGIVRSRAQLLDARRLDVMSDEEAGRALGNVRVLARASPRHKKRIVALLEKRGAVQHELPS